MTAVVLHGRTPVIALQLTVRVPCNYSLLPDEDTFGGQGGCLIPREF